MAGDSNRMAKRLRSARHRQHWHTLTMHCPPAQIPMVFVLGLFSGMVGQGQSLGTVERELLMKVDIDPALLEQPKAQVTADQYARLMRLLMAHTHDETLCLLSRPLRPGTLALLAGNALGASTLAGAMHRLSRSFTLVQDDLEVAVVQDGQQTGLVLTPVARAANQPLFLHELLLRVFWRLLAWLAGGRLPVQRFDLAFERPAHAQNYKMLFPGEVAFEQPRSAFWVLTGDLQDPVRRDQSALRNFLADAQIYIMLPHLGEDTVSVRVRAYLLQSKPHWPDLDECAAALPMAASTLQRRLASEGTSFRAIKDSLRRDAAIARLYGSRVPLGVLAEELGFADSAAFQRAFKTWTGVAPGSLRRTGPAVTRAPR